MVRGTERSRRVWAATEAQAIGYGGIARVARASGDRRNRQSSAGPGVILAGASGADAADTRWSAQSGRRRKRATVTDPTLLRDLDALVEPTAPGRSGVARCGGPARARGGWRGSCDGRAIRSVPQWRSRPVARSRATACKPTSRRARGRRIPTATRSSATSARRVRRLQTRRRQPAISVDTKKKELVGDFKNAGREWRPAKAPERRARP